MNQNNNNDETPDGMRRQEISLITCYKCHSVFADRAKHRSECPSCGHNPEERPIGDGDWYQLNRVVE